VEGSANRGGGGIVALAVLVLIAGWFIGMRLLRSDVDPVPDDATTCTSATIKPGDELPSKFVTVDVYNGSDRPGLANTVSQALQQRGFRQGAVANSPSAITPNTVTILSSNQADPRVQLVAQQFESVDFRQPDITTSTGIAVLVGDNYEGLKDGAANTLKVASEVSVCY
jgi:hypothetical protein